MGGKVDIPPLLPHVSQITDGGFRPRQQDQVCIPRQGLSRADDLDGDARLQLQRVEIVKIGDAREFRNRDPEPVPRRNDRQVRRILRRQFCGVGKPWQHAKRVPARALGYRPHTLFEKRDITTELVDHEPPDQRAIRRIQHNIGPDQLRDHAAAVYVANQDDGYVRRFGKAHIRNVPFPQVDLGGAAGPLDQNKVRALAQTVKAVQNRWHQQGFQLGIVARSDRRKALSLNDDLRASFCLGLQQDRVHVGMRRSAAGARLKRLCAADLSAILGYGRVVRHVLRLERTNRKAAIGKGARQSGDDDRFADVGPRPLNHDRLRHFCPLVVLLPSAQIARKSRRPQSECAAAAKFIAFG